MHGLNCLLVDPDESFARLVVAHFEDLGAQVVWVQDGRTALTQARATSPDAVITSLDIDGMDGFELIERLIHSVPDAKIIICEHHPRARDWDAGTLQRLGVARLVPRPVRLEDLANAVHAAVGRRQARSA